MTAQLNPSLSWKEKLGAYGQLMRIDRPIGTLLLLWPTYWALWVAAGGLPDLKLLLIFTLGVCLTRAAGCVINDFADRKVDGHVKRTQNRPMPSGRVSSREAISLFIGLMLLAFILVLFTDPQTILLSVGGLLLAFSYPFMKRYTHLPQLVLGAAFAWAVPMAFSAVRGEVPAEAWLIYLATLLWTVAYDTKYAMVDRDDDLKIGIKSTAILFGQHDRLMVGLLQGLTLLTLLGLGLMLQLTTWYYLGLLAAGALFVHQQWLIRDRDRDLCFRAFLNNNRVGLAIFAGILLQYSAA
ncbi:4-hydroxybenzoate octaprenyltransferase [Marinobacterium jannaschii]|uniref:4-hydroxybenzoate octaprenyltransferase n=1 Tax=Marinobacterium jannaschii TaxID=64970 RepID=UPI0006866ACA|nr:4-hydroxybenzoate octaprenyltransferase [Marinobacterium jannaschii]